MSHYYKIYYIILYYIILYYIILYYIILYYIILYYISRQAYCLIQSCTNSTDKTSLLNNLTSRSAQNVE